MPRLDLVIFGATGFTGKKTVEVLARGRKDYDSITWGVAGRSRDKLDSLIKEVSKITGKDLSTITIIVADVEDERSLKEMCAQATVLVNCCGPYQLYGEPVVRAAIEMKAHYVDIAAEPQFMKKMQLLYNKPAREAGVYVICACGFDCIPNDMGVMFLQKNFDGILNSVESYVSINLPLALKLEAMKSGLLKNGTWDSIIYIFPNSGEMSILRDKLYPDKMPVYKPEIKNRGAVHKWNGRYCVPLPAADDSVVYRTQRELYSNGHRPVQFRAYFRFSNLFFTLILAFFKMIFARLSKIKRTRELLLRHPRLFTGGLVTKQGPKEEVMESFYFKFELVGKGWAKGADIESTPPNKMAIARVSGMNPAYGATVVALLHSAITILREKDKMPGNGGVLTTALAFNNTTLIQRLNENHLNFEMINNK
ncbi:saccharopine dehydrogenase-like oxidoreductase [Achroia grisella]|uniref:saccharopine dehydrogenase-like oxidoreductase n=1 Tax=Achroia grisella TaxID=688607 RepID=UPI0027D1F671|nr:saccharopine dehydrogenase-like oxidoreductase [Achroia grisella]